jgi:hypothetical protein
MPRLKLTLLQRLKTKITTVVKAQVEDEATIGRYSRAEKPSLAQGRNYSDLISDWESASALNVNCNRSVLLPIA